MLLDDSFLGEFRFSYLCVLIYFAVVISACKSTNFHLIDKLFKRLLLVNLLIRNKRNVLLAYCTDNVRVMSLRVLLLF